MHLNKTNYNFRWVNNLMLKYKNEPDCDSTDGAGSTIENLIFIDFQYSCWTSPAIDLHYFFNNSLQESLRPHRFDELLAFYHAHLASFLERLSYKQQIPTLEQFKKQYLDKSFYGKEKVTLNLLIPTAFCSQRVFVHRSFEFV